MGLREALGRWRARADADADAEPPRDHGAPSPGSHRAAAGPPGSLVVGAAPQLTATPQLPRFYTPAPAAQPAPPADATPGFERTASPQHADERKRVSEAWDLIGGRGADLVRLFYAELFYALGDEALRMFPPG